MLSRTFWVLGFGVVLLAGSVQATPSRASFGSDRGNADRGVLQLGSTEPGDRSQGWSRSQDWSQIGLGDRTPEFSGGNDSWLLPPGLANRDLPPGLAKRDLPPGLARGDSFPPGLSREGDRSPLQASPSISNGLAHPVPEPSALLIFAGGLLLARAAGGRRRT